MLLLTDIKFEVATFLIYDIFPHSQVYLDFGLAVPKLSVQGMISSVKELLELAPLTKVIKYFLEKIGLSQSRKSIYEMCQYACKDMVGIFKIQ